MAALVVLTAGVVGLIQAREARPFRPRVYVIATIVLDVQVLGGLAIHVLGGYWGHDSLSVRLVHPALALLALAAAHVGLKRSRRRSRGQDGNVAAHRTAAGGFLLALLAVLLGIAALSAGLRA